MSIRQIESQLSRDCGHVMYDLIESLYQKHGVTIHLRQEIDLRDPTKNITASMVDTATRDFVDEFIGRMDALVCKSIAKAFEAGQDDIRQQLKGLLLK